MIKTADEIALMAESGRLLAQVFTRLDQLNLIGMNTMQINDLVESYIVQDLQARPASKGQYGYAYVLNSSPNQVVCHGMPSTTDVLKEGDIVNFDITLEKNGFIADSSKTYTVGQVTPAAQKLVDACYMAMWKGIQAVRPGATLGDVGFAISQYARKNGYSVVRDYCGHGIGREMHEAPEVLHWGMPRTGLRLKEGMVFTIEPMLNQGGHAVQTGKDGWTVRTCDGLLSAQFEHTVAVTDSGVRVLTLRPDETIPN
ncbi:type I methionyl aminopeptidase [Alcaligenes sp. A-TC2]|jgi:methionyl aminopeptidase|uniref:type I methionyl aminopeptidase n=1 Tax=Alcaligenes TaxID=507 RepID=UPI000753FF75|nr:MULTISPECIES: type I methionyl aminopeptidase [Alcaligenes]ASC90024.1 type I methionyl aminopeptidase [Alcaligenes faecalis]KVX04143.1 methionine aminopeptidase [Alcaligenes faecalis]MCX5471356.1 type I methionyl aminopeptidase [Alcaligenes nematophilus]QCP81711.1 type I methionyl aminopeptidase [Alcaligenes faecalis]QRF91807.1 type I methionyl aminopeptidase [Alcaligenes faecalis]